MLVHLMVSRRSFRFCLLFFNLFSFCSSDSVISIILSSSSPILSSFLKFIYFIYLFLAALVFVAARGLFSSCGERGLLFVVVRGLLIAVASLAVEHGL